MHAPISYMYIQATILKLPHPIYKELLLHSMINNSGNIGTSYTESIGACAQNSAIIIGHHTIGLHVVQPYPNHSTFIRNHETALSCIFGGEVWK